MVYLSSDEEDNDSEEEDEVVGFEQGYFEHV